MKKALFIFVALVIGIGIGYLIPHNCTGDFTNITKDSESLKALIQNETLKKAILQAYSHSFKFTEKPIDSTLAKKLIAAYKAQNLEDIKHGGGLYSADVNNALHEVGGFVISRDSITKIFKSSPQCNGLRVYFAQHPDFQDSKARVFTFIFAGTKPGPNKAADDTSVDIEDPIYDHVDPCPNNCGTLRP